MTALSPKMKEIQKKHKDDRQKQSEEMMKLYKEHKTNPFSSCLPILIQSPFFFALYRILNGVAKGKPYGAINSSLLASAHQAKLFGSPIAESFVSHTSTSSTKIITIIMIVLMSASQFFTQKQLMTKGMPKMDSSNNTMLQQQKAMLYILPLIFALMGINVSIGVLIYWLTTNVWTMGQQLYVIERNPTPGSPAYEKLQARRAHHQAHNEQSTAQAIEGSENSEAGDNKQAGQRNQPTGKRGKKKPNNPKTQG
jgi:YidC/Oxa1 family membrane protein insertase